jgi:hypothetical protein
MSHNRIFQKKMLDTIMKGGKEIKLSAATQTSDWKRPDIVALGLRESLKKLSKILAASCRMARLRFAPGVMEESVAGGPNS